MKGLGHLREQEKSLHNWVAYKKEEKGEENWKKGQISAPEGVLKDEMLHIQKIPLMHGGQWGQ